MRNHSVLGWGGEWECIALLDDVHVNHGLAPEVKSVSGIEPPFWLSDDWEPELSKEEERVNQTCEEFENEVVTEEAATIVLAWFCH